MCVCVCVSFFFLNRSLFSAHVYFYLGVHGRSQRNDEAWETCSSPWQLYCKPLLSNKALFLIFHPSSVRLHRSHPIIRDVQVLFFFFCCKKALPPQMFGGFMHLMLAPAVSSPLHAGPPPPHLPLPLNPRSGLSCLLLSEPMGVLLESNSVITHASLCFAAIRLVATVRPTFTSLRSSLGFVRFMGVSPFPPPLSLSFLLFFCLTGSCWEKRIHWHLLFWITAVWDLLVKQRLCCFLCSWFQHTFITPNGLFTSLSTSLFINESFRAKTITLSFDNYHFNTNFPTILPLLIYKCFRFHHFEKKNQEKKN